jgi:hypothetical protein
MRLPARAGEPVQLSLTCICRHGWSRTTAAAASVRYESMGWCLDMVVCLSGAEHRRRMRSTQWSPRNYSVSPTCEGDKSVW